MPGKCGPHGSRRRCRDEKLSPLFAADIRAPCFSADVLKKCALIALDLTAEERRSGENGCHAPDLWDEWKLGCLKKNVKVRAKLGLKTRVFK